MPAGTSGTRRDEKHWLYLQMISPIIFKMRSKRYIAFVVLIVVMAACNSSNKSDPEFNYGKVGNQADTANNKSLITLPENSTQTPAIQTTNVASGVNPEHGKPGHRCDIAVGAPLNNKPVAAPVQQTPTVTPVQQSQTVTPVQQTQAITTGNRVTATGMNPEHGKPGHRCDIAVGAPLNSKPITPASQQKSPEVVTAKKTVTAPGMNPPHGEPGHRCDIAVGSPLSQPVKNTTDHAAKTASPKDSTKK